MRRGATVTVLTHKFESLQRGLIRFYSENIECNSGDQMHGGF